MRTIPRLDSWWLDVKLGLRMLVKYPGLALVGVFGIAVAVAIATGGFSIIYGNFLAPSLPLEEGDRIVSMQIWDSAASKAERRILRDYQVWREELKSVQEIGAFRTMTANLIAPGAPPESVAVASMSVSGFGVARVRPLMGRHLVQDDEREGAASVVVIGERVWRNRFGSDPAILGRTIQLGANSFSIVGVMPEGFAFPINHRFWVPLRTGSAVPEPLTGPDLIVFGRLAPAATLENAQVEIATIQQRMVLAFPEAYAQLRTQVLPYAGSFGGFGQTTSVAELLMMNVITTMLLVLVCLNVAILVYTRTAMRQAEISVRTALGASRVRIVTQLFIEAFVLSAVGAIVGIAVAALALRQVAIALLPFESVLPFWVSFQLSPPAVLYAGGLSVLGAAIVGIVPALKATSRRVRTGDRVIGAGGSGMRLGGTWTVLVVAQVAFAVTLLPAAVFNALNNVRLEFADPGFPADEFLTAQLGTGHANRHAELMRRLEAEPQVSSTTFAMAIPGNEPSAKIDTENAGGLDVRLNRVDVNFFRALDVPILAGRGFEPADVASAVVVVNQSFALRIFRGDALGRRIRVESGRWYEIVGIVRDFPAGVTPGMLDSQLKLFHPAAAGQVQPVTLSLRVRDGAPSTFARRLSEIAVAVDPDLQLLNIRSLDDALRQEQWIRRLEAAMLGGISLSVLLLSSAGIYALMSFTVSQRRKEIGIRIALGANRKRIIASIFSRALGQLAMGNALGAAAAAALESGNNLMRDNGAVVLPIVALFMMAVGFVAALGPARRGLCIEPTEALREE